MVTTIEAKQKYWNELADVAGTLSSNLSKILRSPGKFDGNAVDGDFFGWSTRHEKQFNLSSTMYTSIFR